MLVTKETIGSFEIEIHVHANTGKFTATFEEEDYSADTKAALVEELTRAVKRSRDTKAIDVTVLDIVPAKKTAYGSGPYDRGRGVVDASFRGRHMRNNEWLLTADSGQRFKVRRYDLSSSPICRRLTPTEVAEYRALTTAIDEAVGRFDEFKKRVAYTPAQLDDLVKS